MSSKLRRLFVILGFLALVLPPGLARLGSSVPIPADDCSSQMGGCPVPR